MSYTIQGVVAKAGTLPDPLPLGLRRVSLQAGIEMIPFTSEIRRANELEFCPLTDEGCQVLPQTLAELCSRLSAGCELAYIEAEIFGGAGAQAHVLYGHGKAIGPAHIARSAINSALLHLGVQRQAGKDEFDVVGLGLHRNTDGWLRGA